MGQPQRMDVTVDLGNFLSLFLQGPGQSTELQLNIHTHIAKTKREADFVYRLSNICYLLLGPKRTSTA